MPDTDSKKKLVIGILAHVDAGKTTLAEGILYLCGRIRRLGRVDHRDAFLDTYELERARGITIFSKQAQVELEETEITLLDTPGHVDFSAEMERTLQVLDCGILVISGADGVQGHVETLWRLLKRYQIPVFLFVNKMDQEGTDRRALLEELHRRLDERCVDFGECGEKLSDSLAMCSEGLLERFLETGEITREETAVAVAAREVFPCYFGSALKLEGVEDLLEGVERYTLRKEYPARFGARVFKIARDGQGSRLTYLKVTGGSLKVKDLLTNRREDNQEEFREEVWEEKADQIRIYSGAQFRTADTVPAGTVCAVLGLSRTYSGQGLGAEETTALPVLEPVLTYRIGTPGDCDLHKLLGQLRQLEEEVPELHIVWKEAVREIHAQVMGEVQMEVLKNLIGERFGADVEFSAGSIVYKETITGMVEGIGHFEPLRHYAEVHLRLEPGEPGSGLVFGTECGEDVLDRNWQRLILTHLEEKKHPGVLTGSEITDMRITLTAGRAHLKHTEGGDFRQATYRAVRQGLKKAESILLEPVYRFVLELPTQALGRAMTDIGNMSGSFPPPLTEGEISVLTGTVPVSELRGYQTVLTSYTGGRGRLSCELLGYQPCHNPEEVIGAIGYDADADTDNPGGSVFCAHGAGFYVEWDKVDGYAHIPPGFSTECREESTAAAHAPAVSGRSSGGSYASDRELEEIFVRTFGPVKRERRRFAKKHVFQSDIPDRGQGEPARDAQETGKQTQAPDAGAASGVSAGTASGVSAGAASGASAGTASGVSADAASGVSAGTASGVSAGTASDVSAGAASGASAGTASGVSADAASGASAGAASGVSAGASSGAGLGKKPPFTVYGKSSRAAGNNPANPSDTEKRTKERERNKEYLLVDGYNIIFAWEELRELAGYGIDGARGRLLDILCNFQGYHDVTVIVVFDAYKVKGSPGGVEKYRNIWVVYTKEAETADQYIEKAVHEMGRKYHVTVATSDALEQLIIWGQGASRLSAGGLWEEVKRTEADIRTDYLGKQTGGGHYPFQNLTAEDEKTEPRAFSGIITKRQDGKKG